MRTTILKSVACVGGAAIAASSFGAQQADAQSIEGAYAGLTFGIPTGAAEAGYPEYNFGGTVAGAFIGYNALMGDSWGGNLVLGPEFVWYNRANLDLYSDWGYRNLIDLRLRVGQTFGDALVYGALGWSRASVSKGGGSFGSVNGWNIGAGFEMGLGHGMFVGGDLTYRRMDSGFGKADNGNLTTATVRLGFRF